MPRPRHLRAWWRHTVAEFAASGLTAKAFAAQHAVNVATLRWWRGELASEALPGLVCVEITQAPTPPAVLEARVGPAELRFAAGTDVAYVGALLAAIARAASC